MQHILPDIPSSHPSSLHTPYNNVAHPTLALLPRQPKRLLYLPRRLALELVFNIALPLVRPSGTRFQHNIYTLASTVRTHLLHAALPENPSPHVRLTMNMCIKE